MFLSTLREMNGNIMRSLKSIGAVAVRRYSPRESLAIGVVLFVLILPLILVSLTKDTNLIGKAATANSVEPENGTLSGNATVITDANASGGKYITFGALQNPTPTASGPNTTLHWAPPTLVNPQTITLGTGWTSNTLDTNTDYIIKMPSTAKQNQTVLTGGHNIVLIGGAAYLNSGSTSKSVLYIQGATGTVHIEGLLITNPYNKEFDAIDIENSPQATVQIENVRAIGLTGSNATTHADLIQIFNGSGLGTLRVDRFTGTSTYQGFFIGDNNSPLGSAYLQNVNLTYTDPTSTSITYLLWLADTCAAYPTTLDNFYIKPRNNQTVGRNGAWPDSNQSGCPAVENNSIVTWPSLPQVKGSVIDGAPSSDFAPGGTPGLGVPGIGYISPGYYTN